MSVKTEDEAINDVVKKYSERIRRRGMPSEGTRNQGLRTDEDRELEYILRQACEELAFELRPG